MLNYDELQAPAEDGGILVAPAPPDCAKALRGNIAQLAQAKALILGAPLSHWRERTRQRLGVPHGRPLIVTGHQPAFLHAGVWAKNVIAQRIVDAVGGCAVNLVVDSDAPDHSMFEVPSVQAGGVELRRIPIADAAPGVAYEQLVGRTGAQINAFESAVRSAMAAAYERSAMAPYIEGCRSAGGAADWVEQAVAGRRAVDAMYEVTLADHRVSWLWWTPLLCELILNADRFAAAYNRALAEYRRVHRVRGIGQPIPDLVTDREFFEIPVWAYRKGGARQRVGVRRRAGRFTLEVKGEPVLAWDENELVRACDSQLDAGPWMVRPRALTLTLWARLFAGDLFVHGIGGAKYDRISDSIIRDYFGFEPPQIACVSATLRLKLPAELEGPSVASVRHLIRDAQWNPQRHRADGGDVSSLIESRAKEVERSTFLRERNPADRRGRREVFHRIRELNQRLLVASPGVEEERSRELSHARDLAEQRRIAAGREYFFALHEPADLARLVDALPGVEEFRV